MNFNSVIIGGNVTRDPEINHFGGGSSVCNFGIAVNRRFKKDDEWVEEPTFIDVAIFGKRGEAFAQYHKRGSSAFITGSLRLDTWEDKVTGAKRSKLYVVADQWEFVGSKGDATQPSATNDPQPITTEDIPF